MHYTFANEIDARIQRDMMLTSGFELTQIRYDKERGVYVFDIVR